MGRDSYKGGYIVERGGGVGVARFIVNYVLANGCVYLPTSLDCGATATGKSWQILRIRSVCDCVLYKSVAYLCAPQ